MEPTGSGINNTKRKQDKEETSVDSKELKNQRGLYIFQDRSLFPSITKII